MRKTLKVMAFVFVLFLASFKAYALELITNNNGIEMSENEYENLLNMGFTENEIMNMQPDEFENNKNLNGEIVSQNVTYLDKNNNEIIVPYSYYPGYLGNYSRAITTTIVSYSDRYRFKITSEWKVMPSVRSYDIMGIGFTPNVSIFAGSYFQQNFCYTNGGCASSVSSVPYETTTGAARSFKLVSGTLSSLSAYMYYDVEKATTSTITELRAVGDYKHAIKTVSSGDAKKYTINRGGIILNQSIASSYDSIGTATAVLDGISW